MKTAAVAAVFVSPISATYTEETLPGDAVRLGVWGNRQILTISVQF
jgi:hypothetical protein